MRLARRLALASLLLGSPLPAAVETGIPPEPGWQVVGSFRGAAGPGLISRLNDWLFENERDGDLYQDLGNLSVGVGYGVDGVDLDWTNDFRRRVVTTHRALPAGAVVQATDVSGYREISQGRSRLRLTWDYLPDLLGDLDVGAQVEGGYVVGLARHAEPPAGQPSERLVRRGAGREYREFLREHEIRGTTNPLYLAAGYGGGIIDMVAGALGSQMADTERAVVFFDDYAAPAVLFPDLGLPLRARLFEPTSDELAVGDVVTYTAFVGISPLHASLTDKGLRVSSRRFWRFLRETTVERRGPSRVVVRVRRSAAEGNEVIPLKFRPEVRWLAFSAGYTFFEMRRDRFDEEVDDVTYRIDLAQPEARAFFRRLLSEGANVEPISAPLEPPPAAGVQLLRATRRVGPVRDRRLEVDLFSWLRYEWRKLATEHRIETPQLVVDEIVRQHARELRKPFGRRRDYKSNVLLTAQSDLSWRDPAVIPRRAARSPGLASPSSAVGVGSAAAVTIETEIRSRRVFGSELAELGDDLERILGLRELGPLFTQLETAGYPATSGLALSLRLSFGQRQIERLLTVSQDEIWLLLAELMLGPQHGAVWATPERRAAWMPIERSHGWPAGGGEHISRRYDRLRGGRPRAGKGLGLTLDHLDSRTLFIKASHLVDAVEKARRRLAAGSCLPCLADLFGGASDALLLQALLVSLAGGIDEEGGVGYALELFTDQLGRPLRYGNDTVYTYRHQRREEPVQEVYSLVDAEPRLRAGEMLLPVAPGPGEPCWKLRLYSDLVFGEAMQLRLAVRDARPGADETAEVRTVGLPAPQAIAQAPFVVSRFYYDFPLAWSGEIRAGAPYTVLVRLLGPGGEPVTEEQELRFRLPRDWAARAAEACPVQPPQRLAAAGRRGERGQIDSSSGAPVH